MQPQKRRGWLLLCACCMTTCLAREYWPTDAPGIIAAINTAGAGDVVYLPTGSFDCRSTDLRPAAGASIIGAGKDRTVIQGRLQALLAGSPSTLSLVGWTLDMSGMASFIFGPCEVREGRFYANDWRATGATVANANAFTAVTANGHPYDVLLEDCEIDTADNDCVSTKLLGQGVVDGSRLRIEGGHYHDCGDSSNDEMLTGHSGLAIEAVGALIDQPGAFNHAVLPDQQTPMTLIDCVVQGNVTASDVEHCDIDADGATVGLTLQQDMAGVAKNNHIFNLHPTDWAFAVQMRGGRGVSQTAEANILEGGGDKCVGVKASSVAGTIEVVNNRITDFTHGVDLRGNDPDFTAGLVANNVIDVSTFAIMGDNNNKTTSRDNLVENGSLYQHAPGEGDKFDVAELDGQGRPLPGGNCDYGAGDGLLRPGTGIADATGTPKIFYDRDVIGPLFPDPPAYGDLNRDGAVDDADWNGFMQCYGTAPPHADWACGDMNLDGAVDADDYQLFRRGYLDSHPGQSFPYALPGDFNGDGRVEQDDLNLLLIHWGAATQPVGWTGPFDGRVDQSELNDLLSHWGLGIVRSPSP